MKKYNKIVLTGASGRLGSYLREPLSKISKKLVSTDKDDIGKTLKNEVFKKIKLENFILTNAYYSQLGEKVSIKNFISS